MGRSAEYFEPMVSSLGGLPDGDGTTLALDDFSFCLRSGGYRFGSWRVDGGSGLGAARAS